MEDSAGDENADDERPLAPAGPLLLIMDVSSSCIFEVEESPSSPFSFEFALPILFSQKEEKRREELVAPLLCGHSLFFLVNPKSVVYTILIFVLYLPH